MFGVGLPDFSNRREAQVSCVSHWHNPNSLQKFTTMDLGLRNDVRSIFEEKAEKYGLDDITFNSFTSSFGFRHCIIPRRLGMTKFVG